jgi:hypothetical protein
MLPNRLSNCQVKPNNNAWPPLKNQKVQFVNQCQLPNKHTRIEAMASFLVPEKCPFCRASLGKWITELGFHTSPNPLDDRVEFSESFMLQVAFTKDSTGNYTGTGFV